MKKTGHIKRIYALRSLIALLVRPVVLTVIGGLLGGCSPAESLYPFYLCVAGVNTGRDDSVFLAAGSIIASLIREFSVFTFTAYCVPIVLYFAFSCLLRAKKQERLWLRIILLAVCGGVGLILSYEARMYDIIMLLLSIAGSCALVPILDSAANAVLHAKSRSVLTKGELACVAVLICGAVISVPEADLLGVSPLALVFLAVCAILSLATPEGISVAFAGMCTIVFLIKKMNADVCITLLMCVVMADLLKGLGRFSAITGFLLADIMLSLALRASGLIIPLQTVLIGGLPTLILKRRQIYALKGIGGRMMISTSSERLLATRCVAQTAEKLRRGASVFEELGKIFKEGIPDKRARRKELCAGAASRVCSKCDGYDYCWRMRYSDTYSDFKDLASLITLAGSLSPYDVNGDFKARCKDWIGVLLDMNNANSAPLKEDNKGNAVMAKQCKSLANMLYALADDALQAEYDHDAEQRISTALTESGFLTRDVVCVVRDGVPTSIRITMQSCKGDKPCGGIPALLRRCLGVRFTLNSKQCTLPARGCSMEFLPVPPLKALCHASCKIKEGQSVCGDSFSLLELPGGKYLAAISDGMGSGAEAAGESENAVALLETLCMGQMDLKCAYDTVNQLLQLRQKNPESYSTMDACVLDLAGGYCSWGKIGAVPGYVMRSGRVELVRGESLPMGILNSITPSITDRVIRAGDVLLLVSDGIYDVMVDDCNDFIAQTLCDMKESLPSDISSAILKSAVKKCGGRARDDMTAIAIKIVAS